MKKTTSAHGRTDEQGIALVVALFMMLAMSVLGTSLMFVSKTETLSSHNYRLMSQARYGAESGINVAANYLMSAGYTALAPSAKPGASDPFTNYDLTKSPVQFGGKDVVLASTAGASNYPAVAVKNAFAALFTNASLNVNDAPVAYKATATLKAMRDITDNLTKTTVVIQTWEIVGEGSIAGARQATVEVSSIVEREIVPIFAYAAFSTSNGCVSMKLGGGGQTDSYDHRLLGHDPATGDAILPVPDATDGDVGSNGNLTASGQPTIVNGSLSTPRSGVGKCDAGAVNAATLNGGATVAGGYIQLAQEVKFPDPPKPNPMPPVGTTVKFQNITCPIPTASGCKSQAYKGVTYATLDPALTANPTQPVVLSEVELNAPLVLKTGTYNFNSIKLAGGGKIIIDGDVTINVAGLDNNGSWLSSPIQLVAQGVENDSLDPTKFHLNYGGTGDVKLAGGNQNAALVYAPRATASFTGGADLYGAVVVSQLTDMGGTKIHYDRAMKNDTLTAGNFMLSAFTWKNY